MQAARARVLLVRDAQGGLPELRRQGGTGAVGGRQEPSDEELRLVPRRLGQADELERRGAGAKRLLWIGEKRTLNGTVRVITKRACGFRTYRAVEVALYHNLGRLPEPDFTRRFC